MVQIISESCCGQEGSQLPGMVIACLVLSIVTHLVTTRRLVRDIMHEHAPDGFDIRFPGKKVALIRRPLTAIGPFHEVSSDGHEKLGCQALAMGEIGLPIYAYKDKWSDALLKISVVPNCRSAGAIGHLYLDLIEQIGGENFTYGVDSRTDH